MRARLVAVLAAAACAAGCALLLGDDTFAGRYRVADPKDRTKGRQSHPVVCSVPRDVAIRLDPRAALRASKTGWILVAPTANGLVFGDLVRER